MYRDNSDIDKQFDIKHYNLYMYRQKLTTQQTYFSIFTVPPFSFKL